MVAAPEISCAGAAVAQDAELAAGPAGVADAAAVADQRDVEVVVAVGGQLRFERIVGLDGVDLRADQAEPLRDAVDVGVDGQGGSPEREEQHAGGGLGSHAGQ